MPNALGSERSEITAVDENALDGQATRKEITIHFTANPDDPKLHLLIYLPIGFNATHLYPVNPRLPAYPRFLNSRLKQIESNLQQRRLSAMTTNKQETWRTTLTQARQALLTLLNSLEPAQWDAVVFSENEPQTNQPWTVATAVGHVIDSERGMSIQVHKIRKGEPTIPEGFDLDRWNAGVQKRLGNPSPTELLAALDSTRAKTLEGLASLQAEEWALSGRHPSRGIITIEQYYATIAGHDRMHIEDIQQALALK